VAVQVGPSRTAPPRQDRRSPARGEQGRLEHQGGKPARPSSHTSGRLAVDPGAIRMKLYPDGMSLPYVGGVVVVQPMTLRLAAGGLVEEICSGRGLNDVGF